MALGMSTYLGLGWLNSLGNNTSFVVVQCYVKLHVGEPGAAGTANPATETTRKAASFATAAGGSGTVVMANDAAVTWTAIAGSQDASHFSLWDTIGPAGGNYLGCGLNTAGAYLAGDTYDVSIGSLTITLTVAT